MDQLYRVPYVQQRPRGHLEPGDGRELEDVCARLEQLVGGAADEPKHGGGGGGDVLRSTERNRFQSARARRNEGKNTYMTDAHILIGLLDGRAIGRSCDAV